MKMKKFVIASIAMGISIMDSVTEASAQEPAKEKLQCEVMYEGLKKIFSKTTIGYDNYGISEQLYYNNRIKVILPVFQSQCTELALRLAVETAEMEVGG